MKTFLNILVKISISVVLLIFLFRRIDFKQTLYYMRTVDPVYFTYAVLLFLLVTFLGVARWSVLLKILNKDLVFSRIFIAHCGGLFFNVFLPSTIGGDVARTVDLSLHTKDGSSVFATVFLDRLFGFLALVVIYAFGYFFGYAFGLGPDLRFLVFMVILAVIVFFAFLVIFSKGIFDFVNRILIFQPLKVFFSQFHDCCYSFRFQKLAMVKTFLLSLMIQGFFSVVVYFLGISLGIRLSIIHYIIIMSIVNTVSFLPISLGGLGLRDNVAVILFSALGVAPDKVAAMTLLIFAFIIFVGIMGGIVYGASLYSRRL